MKIFQTFDLRRRKLSTDYLSFQKIDLKKDKTHHSWNNQVSNPKSLQKVWLLEQMLGSTTRSTMTLSINESQQNNTLHYAECRYADCPA